MEFVPFFLLFSPTLFVDGDFFDIVDFADEFSFLILEAFVCTYLYAPLRVCVRLRNIFYDVLGDFLKERCIFWITQSLMFHD